MANVSFEMHCADAKDTDSTATTSDATASSSQSVVVKTLPLDHQNHFSEATSSTPSQQLNIEPKNNFVGCVTINNRTLINVIMPNNSGPLPNGANVATTAIAVAKQTSAIAVATLEAVTGTVSSNEQKPNVEPEAAHSKTTTTSIQEHWYSLPLRWRTHPSATVDRRPRNMTKKKSQRHSWHVSEPIISASSILDCTISNAAAVNSSQSSTHELITVDVDNVA